VLKCFEGGVPPEITSQGDLKEGTKKGRNWRDQGNVGRRRKEKKKPGQGCRWKKGLSERGGNDKKEACGRSKEGKDEEN